MSKEIQLRLGLRKGWPELAMILVTVLGRAHGFRPLNFNASIVISSA